MSNCAGSVYKGPRAHTTTSRSKPPGICCSIRRLASATSCSCAVRLASWLLRLQAETKKRKRTPLISVEGSCPLAPAAYRSYNDTQHNRPSFVRRLSRRFCRTTCDELSVRYLLCCDLLTGLSAMPVRLDPLSKRPG